MKTTFSQNLSIDTLTAQALTEQNCDTGQITRSLGNPLFRVIRSVSAAFACVLISLCANLLPVGQAKAGDIYQTLETVCNQAQGLCGPGYLGIVDGCFKGSDELKCAIAIINVSSGGQVSNTKSQIDAIIACVNDGLPIKEACNNQLKAAGVSGAKINEAYALINRCVGIDDVDDAIMCADALLDSSIAEDVDLGIPSWVDSMFDVYVDLREKDYWGLVYHVGATIACAVANYFSGVDVCAFLEELAEIAGDVIDGAKAIGGAINNAGEKIFTNQTQHMPVVQFFLEYWAPDVDNYARSIVVQKNTGYWDANVGTKHTHCKNYFDSHTMSEDKANRACNDMRDGTNVSDNSFIDKGFSQLASRRGAIMLLPPMLKPAAVARIAQLRAQGVFKADSLPANLQAYDPWHNAAEVPGVELQVYRLYGLNDQGSPVTSGYHHEAKNAAEAWPEKTVGYVAYLNIASAKVAPAVLNFPTSEGIAKNGLSSGEAAINFVNEIKAFIQKAQAARLKTVEQFGVINKSLQESNEKPLNDMLALCAPKSLVSCEREVRDRFAVCDAKAKAYADANAGVLGDFDSSQGKAAYKQWIEISRSCEASIKQYVESLPNGSKTKQITAIDTSGMNTSASGAQKNAQNLNAASYAGNTSSGNKGAGTGVGNSASSVGNLSDALKRNSAGNMASSGTNSMQNNSPLSTGQSSTGASYGQNPASNKPALGLSAPTSNVRNTESTDNPAALAQCKAFLGRKDELLCTSAAAFNACKAQVDKRQLRLCRIVGSQEVYPAIR